MTLANRITPGLLKRMNWKELYDHWNLNGEISRSDVALTLAYMRGFQDFNYFVEYFFPHHCQFTFSRMHERFFTDEANPDRRGRRDVIAAPRGHAKTTFKVLFKAIHAIVYGYETFILVIGHSSSEAQGKVQNILDELQNNQRLIEICGELAPPVKRRSRKGFVTQNGIRVMAKSKGQQVRGLLHGQYRPSLILCDDIESLDGTLTPEQRVKTRNWFFKDVMKCGQVDGSNNKPYKLPTLIRDTMRDVEEIARFRAPKYLAAYLDVLKFHLEQIGRSEIFPSGLQFDLFLEFGVATKSLLSLISLGLSRTSAVEINEFLGDDSLDEAEVLRWLASRDWEAIDVPRIVKHEIAKMLERFAETNIPPPA